MNQLDRRQARAFFSCLLVLAAVVGLGATVSYGGFGPAQGGSGSGSTAASTLAQVLTAGNTANSGQVIKFTGTSTVGISVAEPDGSWLAIGNGTAGNSTYGLICSGIIVQTTAGIGLAGAEAGSSQLIWGTGAGAINHVVGPTDQNLVIVGGVNRCVAINKNGSPSTNVSLAINSGRLFNIDGIYVRSSTSAAGGFPPAGGLAVETVLGFYNGAGAGATIPVGISWFSGSTIAIGNGTAGNQTGYLLGQGSAWNDGSANGFDIAYTNTAAFQGGSATTLGWTNGIAGGTNDTALSRDAAGVVDFGTGVQGSTAGSWKATNGTLSGGITITNTATNTPYGYQALSSLTTGANNTAFGYQALKSTTTGIYNTGVGFQALTNNTVGINNIAVGNQCLQNNTSGNNNVAVGYAAMQSLTTGISNVGIGYHSLYQSTTASGNTAVGMHSQCLNTTGDHNTAFGQEALYTNQTAVQNTAVGSQVLYFNTTGNNNTAVGFNTLTTNTSGDSNTAVGTQALDQNTTGSLNVVSGFQASFNNTSGSSNSSYGYQALYSNTSGAENCAFGIQALYLNTTASDNTAFGTQALFVNTGSNNAALGRQALHDNSTGANNAAVGFSALSGNTTGQNNSGLGSQALFLNTTGGNNTVIGTFAGFTPAGVQANANTTGGNNTYLGYQTGANSATQRTNTTTVGYQALSTADNQVSLGDLNVTSLTTFGKWTNYNGVACQGKGVSAIYGLDFRQGVTSADGAATTLYTTVNGTSVFRITADIFATAVTSGTATYTVTWTQNATTQTMVVSSTVINTLGTATDLINPDNGTNITAKLTGTFSQTVTITALVEQLK